MAGRTALSALINKLMDRSKTVFFRHFNLLISLQSLSHWLYRTHVK
ncbi:hypothetical protein LEP1GSC060_2863 [Leptospira weilii serovar Ranarum str. ICFT]|uniref:Uncharacterized protein n=1 Tax=Leptospira weilii serovar Ranarum str. ICFT TaxID=1218598 RepID=N1WJ16_9LEPT|nr:hypothetical protein LEP1GSC060_2863 [Leptospira weilii serovar Ranarum str. ICFT]